MHDAIMRLGVFNETLYETLQNLKKHYKMNLIIRFTCITKKDVWNV